MTDPEQRRGWNRQSTSARMRVYHLASKYAAERDPRQALTTVGRAQQRLVAAGVLVVTSAVAGLGAVALDVATGSGPIDPHTAYWAACTNLGCRVVRELFRRRLAHHLIAPDATMSPDTAVGDRTVVMPGVAEEPGTEPTTPDVLGHRKLSGGSYAHGCQELVRESLEKHGV